MIVVHNKRPFVTIFCYHCASRWVYLLDLCNACEDSISLSILLLKKKRLNPSCFSYSLQDLVGEELEQALQIGVKQLRGAAIKVIEEKVLGALTEEGVRKALALQAAELQVPQEAQVGTWEDEEMIEEDGLVDEGDVHVTPVSKKPIIQVCILLSSVMYIKSIHGADVMLFMS